MDIVDLSEEYLDTYCVCLEDWSEEMKDAGHRKREWHRRMKDRGLGVKLAVKNGAACGMIQYLPIEESFVEGTGLYLVACIWVHGYKEGIGNHQKQGIGSALLSAAEDDARSKGAAGMAAWGLALPIWMKASWFKKHGYRKADRVGIQVLLWKPFTDDARPPVLLREKRKPEKQPGKVTVTAYNIGWCPAQNITFERARRAAGELGDKVEFTFVDTSDRETLHEWGIADAVYVDGRKLRTGPPPSYEKIKKTIAKRVKKLSSH